MKKIGIIGGAGPMASSLLYNKIVEECYKKFNLSENFPEIIIINYPFSPGRKYQDNIQKHDTLINELQHCIDILAHANANLLAIACNTLHTFINNVNIEKDSTFIHLINLVKQKAKNYNLKKILILGTQTTVTNKLYEDNYYAPCYLNSKHQNVLDEIIEQILLGNVTEYDSKRLTNIIIEEHKKHKFEGVVFGCTDLSIICHKFNIILPDNIKPLDTITILANELVNKCC